MPVGLVPVHDPAAVVRVYAIVDGTVNVPPEGDSGRFDALENGVELVLTNSKAVVNPGKRLRPLVEIESQSVVHVNRREWTDTRLRPRHAEQPGEELRRGYFVTGWNHEMVKMDGHRDPRHRRATANRLRIVLV